jgi:hypothetical protein
MRFGFWNFVTMTGCYIFPLFLIIVTESLLMLKLIDYIRNKWKDYRIYLVVLFIGTLIFAIFLTYYVYVI